MLLNRLFLRKVAVCIFACSITVGAFSGTMPIAIAQEPNSRISAESLEDPVLAKQRSDELIRSSYVSACKKLIKNATKPFYSVANLRLSVTPGSPLSMRLEKWSGPGKMRESLSRALNSVDLPPLPSVLVDQANLEFSASRQCGVVESGSPHDPFKSIKARLIAVQEKTNNTSLDDLSTETLEEKWQSFVAWYEWPDFLVPISNALEARYEKEHQAQKLKALNESIKDLSGKPGKSQIKYLYNLLYQANKLYSAGKVTDAGAKYRQAAAYFDLNLAASATDDWPPFTLFSLYTYSCFLASQKQFAVSNTVFEKVVAEAQMHNETSGSLLCNDYLDTYLELIREAQPERYLQYRAWVKDARFGGMHATGYIDRQGKTAISPDFVRAKEFKDNLAAVETVRGWGYIDKLGAWKIAPSFKTADNFGAGLAPVSGNKRLFPFEEPTNEKALTQYINAAGKVVIPESFESATPFVDRLATVQSIGEQGGHFVDKAGKKVSPTDVPIGPFCGIFVKSVKSRMVGELQDSYLVRVIRSGPDKDGQYKFEPDDLNPFAETDAAKEYLFGYRDAAGKVLIEPKYTRALPFTDGLAAVEVTSGKYGFIDKSGAIKIAAQYSSAQLFQNGLVWVSKDNKYFLIDKNGEVKSDLFDRIDQPYGMTGMMAYTGDKKFLFSDQVKGLDVSAYDSARPFHEGLAAVQKDNNWGFIDTEGKLVIPMQYGSVGDFSEGLASANFR
ncbi:hypothetical protein BH11CYA1_BH11CYA1_17640 [soil metagenome]